MKAKDWEFKKVLTDFEDGRAGSKSMHQFFSKNIMEYCDNHSDAQVHCFISGFMRGIAWTKAKHNIKDNINEKNI